jgi:hypothetical protein
MEAGRTEMSEGPCTATGHIVTLSKCLKLPHRERKKIETHGCIYPAAFTLFAEKGLEATTLDQIMDLADVAKGRAPIISTAKSRSFDRPCYF